MKIGILAFGSLVDDSGSELLKHIGAHKVEVETHFKVEYFRSSKKRNGAPTLVPVEKGGGSVRAYILPLKNISLSEAKNMLYRREINEVGKVSKSYSHSDNPSKNKTIIEEHKNLHGFDVLLTARLQSNLDEVTPEILANLAIESAKGETLKENRDGITYLKRNIRNGIVTPLTGEYRQHILEKLGVKNLEEAIQKLKDSNQS